MQIVIDIPKTLYNRYKEKDYIKRCDIAEYEKALDRCIILPKGHGDLIDVNRKITVTTYDEQHEEWGEETLTVLEALNRWSDEGVGVGDVVISADTESE